MTGEFKLDSIKLQLGIADDTQDSLLENYLTIAEHEILAWLYQMQGSIPTGAVLPSVYDVIHINAVIEGFNHNGAEGEIVHNENGINRTFKYESMVSYIHANVFPYVGVAK